MNFHPSEPLPDRSDAGGFGPGRRLSKKDPSTLGLRLIRSLGYRRSSNPSRTPAKTCLSVSCTALGFTSFERQNKQRACFVGRSGSGRRPAQGPGVPQRSEPEVSHHRSQHGRSGAGQNRSSARPHRATQVHTWYRDVGRLGEG